MSDPIMQKLDEMLDITRSSSVPLGVPVARHNDLLLRDTERALRAAVAALKAVLAEHYPSGVEPACNCCSPACACGHWEYPCPTVKAVEEALGDVVYAELVATLPRPVGVWKSGFTAPWLDPWTWSCRLCPGHGCHQSQAAALGAALCYLHDEHGCPNRRTTGEPCDTACIHCHGWQWCAEPSERREA